MRRAAILSLFLLLACSPDPEPAPAPSPVPQTERADAALPTEELVCLATAAYFEARGEGEEGMAAVAHVVMNRAESEAYPDTPCAVVTQRRGRSCQFSWYCDGKPDQPKNLARYAEALTVARAVMNGEAPDPTDGATMFHASRSTPYWAQHASMTAEIGSHRFYRLD
ncbi:cell wall hydrolase [Parvularcula dongshanensis]|uniref:Spore germination cell wall hydrolase CwlJ-like protein n=1 Tax=Parvularcula dongshanensis TaxID=1173995 RepID=A0A840I6B6_9PROT|nr:cell wall hydrolase [Parvularcula dongshanensis]MBB4659724.1 spore germination cell wall hydrolase CwlJ-like protein [Parvularcula dongshanensis]